MQNTILTCRRLFITDCKISNTRLGSLGLNRWLLRMAGKFASRITCPMAGASTSEAFGTSFQLCQMLDTILYTELCPENVLTFAFAFVLAFETLGLPLAKASGHVTYIELMGSFCKAIKPIS
jgi:hypothetical protein